MISIPIGTTRFCDGVSRRAFLQIGAVTCGAMHLTLSDLLRAEAAQDPFPRTRHKGLIHIFLGGGPPHQDMWEIKTEAPAEIRGEFQPIPTSVPGIQIGECFPRIARLAHKFVFIRSVVGLQDRHDAIMCTTGWPANSLSNMGGRPSIGSVVARLQGPVDPSVPPFIGLAERTQHVPWSDPGQPGFLGPTFAAFRPSGPDMANMVLNTANREHLPDRKTLLRVFDNLKRQLDYAGTLEAADNNTQRALEILTSSKLVEALDLSRESPKLRERYGDGKPYKYQYDGAPTVNEHLLIARRLIEAGARVVSLSYGRWDSHGKNFDLVRDHGGKLDQCLTALVEDLDARGLLDDVTVIAWGEFGRTPRINKDAGRDHWAPVSCAILAGGGMRTGQAIGSTDRTGSYAKDRPVHYSEIVATLYHNLGLDPSTTTVLDPTGRPQHLVEAKPLPEVI
jgi:hypothetical protein